MKDEIDILLKELGDSKYPYPVDVVDKVMADIEKVQPRKPVPIWLRAGAISAACFVGVFATQLTFVYSGDYNETVIGTMIATSYELDSDSYNYYSEYQEYSNSNNEWIDMLISEE